MVFVSKRGSRQNLQRSLLLKLHMMNVSLKLSYTGVSISDNHWFFCFTTGIFTVDTPLEYNVLLNASSPALLVKPAGRAHFAFVDGLDPFTLYEIRIQACQNGKRFFKRLTSVTGRKWRFARQIQLSRTDKILFLHQSEVFT